jgi:hypothetical protein
MPGENVLRSKSGIRPWSTRRTEVHMRMVAETIRMQACLRWWVDRVPSCGFLASFEVAYQTATTFSGHTQREQLLLIR